jgi:CheY-like chemotaxis protein
MDHRGKADGGGEFTVLFVDDYAEYAAGRAYLERVDEGLTVLPETSGEAALARLSREPVDCVVCDYRMPGMSGVDLPEAAREERPGLPFVLLTGHELDRLDPAVGDGATEVLQKGSGTNTFRELRATVRDLASTQTGFCFDNATR